MCRIFQLTPKVVCCHVQFIMRTHWVDPLTVNKVLVVHSRIRLTNQTEPINTHVWLLRPGYFAWQMYVTLASEKKASIYVESPFFATGAHADAIYLIPLRAIKQDQGF